MANLMRRAACEDGVRRDMSAVVIEEVCDLVYLFCIPYLIVLFLKKF